MKQFFFLAIQPKRVAMVTWCVQEEWGSLYTTPHSGSWPKTSIARSGTPCWGCVKSNYEQLWTVSLHYNTSAQPDLAATRHSQGWICEKERWSSCGEANEGKQVSGWEITRKSTLVELLVNNLAKQMQTWRCCCCCCLYFWPGSDLHASSCRVCVCFCVVSMGGNCSVAEKCYISAVCYQFTHICCGLRSLRLQMKCGFQNRRQTKQYKIPKKPKNDMQKKFKSWKDFKKPLWLCSDYKQIRFKPDSNSNLILRAAHC